MSERQQADTEGQQAPASAVPDPYVNPAGKPICGAPCYYGGSSSATKYSAVDLGWAGHCNQVVRAAGERCWRHQSS